MLKDVKIIFLTAIVSQKEAGAAGGIGGFPFMAKPVSLAALTAMIEETVGG
jgi:DNA-binding response OmpR family regulator